jgi:hypothetical protein
MIVSIWNYELYMPILLIIFLPCTCTTDNLAFLSAIVQGSRMLKPEKWHTCFDSEGRVMCFRKALKFIVLGVS